MSSINRSIDSHFDAIVCGSGAGVCVVAVELAKAGMSVLVLEAGDADGGSLENITYRLNVEGKKSPLYNYGRQLGGSTNLWSGRTSFFEPIDFLLHEWPLSYEDLEADIGTARNIINAPEPDLDSYLHRAFSGLWAQLAAPPFSLKPFVMQHRTSPFNAYSYLKNSQLNKLKVCENIIVRRVLHNDVDTATGLEVYDRATDTIMTVSADLFILATGGLDIPRLLLESALPASSGHSPIGNYMSTHPKLHVGTLKLSKRTRASNALVSDIFMDDQYVRLGLGLDADILRREGMLNHYFQVSPVL